MACAWAACFARGFTAVALALVLTACGPSDSQRLADARRHLDRGDVPSAVIELKNLLNKNPSAGVARYLLGRALLQGGDALGAEAELRRAKEAGHALDQVAPLLAEALARLQRFETLLAEFGSIELADPAAAVALHVQRATAQMALGQQAKAQRSLDAALALSSTDRPTLELMARFRAARGDAAAAAAIADGLIAKSAQDAAAWTLKGDVLAAADRSTAGAASAGQAYARALALQADHVPAHAGLIALLIEHKQFDAARTQLQALKVVRAKHPQTRFFEALLAIEAGDASRSRELAQGLLSRSPDNPRLLMLAGQAEMLAGAYGQAETHLARSSLLSPGALQPRQLLAQMYLRQGQARKAMDLVALMQSQAPDDAMVMTLAGQAHLLAGSHAAAEELFARAQARSPGDVRARTGLALAQLERSRGDAGVEALEAIARADLATTADLALINTRLRRKEYAPALAAIDRLAAKTPKDPLPDWLRGQLARQRGDATSARKSWEGALLKQASYLPALTALAELDVAQAKPEQARARLAAALKREPSNTALRVALADITGRTGGSKEEVVRLMQEAIRANATDVELRVQLVDYALGLGDLGLALATAQDAVAALAGQPLVLDRLGVALQAAGDAQQALSAFGKLRALRPKALEPLLRIIGAQLALGQYTEAWSNARYAVHIAPDSADAAQAAVTSALLAKRPTDALAMAQALQKQRPDDPAGLVLEAQVESVQGDAAGAVATLRRALVLAPRSEVAQALHGALWAANRAGEAEQHAEAWIRTHPADTAFVLQLGIVAQQRGKLDLAEARFRQILQRQPNNVEALNNAAYVLALQGKPGAVTLAERADRLAPNRPPLMDTLAFSLAAEGRLPPAVALQTRVVALAPDRPQFRLMLARLQLRAGDKAGALENLRRLDKYGSQFNGREEAARLLKEAGG